MPSIFISYRRDPQAAWAGRLHDRLAAHFGAASVFLDVAMEPGIDFVQAIEERVSRCDVLIALIGKDWRPERLARPEDWVRLEIEAALKRGIRVIPVLVDGVRMPAAEDLPESLRPLVRRHALDVGHASFRRDTEVLIHTIEGLQVATAPREAVAPSMPRRFDKRLVIGLAAALIVPAGSYYAWRRPPELERKQNASEPRTRQMQMEDSLTYVWIPPGKFQMGCSPGDGGCYDDEKPPHEVEITRGFWLGQTEVTQAAWRKIMRTDPGQFKGDQLPVETVTWEQARAYCARIGGRLPAEAEWEYAARAGNPSSRYGDLSAIAWDGAKGTNPVGSRRPNAWGLYDMLGNVWEWTADWYDGKYYQSKVAIDPAGPESGTGKVLRGGSWFLYPVYVRVSVRARNEPTDRNNSIGFRCAGEFR